MVGPNGSALSYEDDLKQIAFNGTQAPTDTKETPPRRTRSTQAVRGPKPLLPRSLKEALQLAELLSKSKLIPKGFETPETCLVGILYGMEVGLSPIAALQRMAVIDGRPTIWGDAALALVQASGLLQSIKEDVIEDQKAENTNPLTAICMVKREGRSEPITGTFSIEDAKRAGLWQKPGPWTDYPKRMLIMRARAFALRDAFPDVLAGLYIREEFEGSEKRQSRLPQDQPKSEDADWNAIGVEQSASMQAARRAPPPPPDSSQQSEKGTESIRGTENERSTESVRDTEREKDPITHSEYKDRSDTVESPVDVFVENKEEGDAKTHLDPETLLDLFDSALCCALDLPTLEEIVDDFAERLRPLDKYHQRLAQKIIDRHQSRVEDLDQSDLSASDNRIQPSDLPRGLKSLLPNLGIGRKLTTRRIETRGNRLARSLASWNARQPLIHSIVKIEDREEVPAPDHMPEVSE